MFLVIIDFFPFLSFLGDESLGLLGVFNIFQPRTDMELNTKNG